MKRYLGIFLGLVICAPAMALIDGGKTTLVCGSVICANTPDFTGIDNLSIGGHLYDVTFSSTTMSSPFAFSANAAKPGQAATAVDAANALNSFFGTQIFASSPGDPSGPVGDFITAIEPLKNGTFYQVAAAGFFGVIPPPTLAAPFTGDTFGAPVSIGQFGAPCEGGSCTVWTAVSTSAPEIAPGSLVSVMTLLFGGVAVMRGARRKIGAG